MLQQKLSPIETIKEKSNGLRGTLAESLLDAYTGAVREPDEALIKFHGMYQQDNRDVRSERALKKLERLYSFMLRLRIPGGLIGAKQWLAANQIADKYATGIIKITTRQTIQLHGIFKKNIKPTLQDFDLVALDSIAACGDVNRNVLCSANPVQTKQYKEVFEYADWISQLLLPKTRAYYEIWLDQEKLTEKTEDDPLYQERYLPRKFKIAIGIPPNNDVDVFANDIGLIAIIENGNLQGFNIAVGGGLSATHGNPNTYPRIASVIGYVAGKENILKTIYEILTIQRDFGNRSDRKLARLKYTIDTLSLPIFVEKLEARIGFKLAAAKDFSFTERTDYYGWKQCSEGLWHYTLFVENGLILDYEETPLKSTLLEIAKQYALNFRFTGNQNIILSDIKDQDKTAIHQILEKTGLIAHTENASALRKNAMACVALPTCPLALAEGQRYMPLLITKIEPLLDKYGLKNEKIIARMTGCPNGCGRSPIAEIGFIGTGEGRYNLQIGGDYPGYRLNKLYEKNLNETEIVESLDKLFQSYVQGKKTTENFGDFCCRTFLNP